MKTTLNKRSTARTIRAALLAGMGMLALPQAGADLKELSLVPLANIAGSVSVKPNVLFVLDDSGSMQWEYLPDYVNDSNTSLAPKYSGVLGDPPFMSAMFNRQYYNPDITYSPPVAYDGTSTQGALSFLSQDRTNTTNWTSVRTDGFNKQNKNQLGTTTSYVNLVTAYPDRAYCTSTGDSPTSTTLCKTNSSSFIYANNYSSIKSDPYIYGVDGSSKVKYRYGAPYYFNIKVWEYCSDEALTSCVAVTPGSAAPAGYPYSSRMRWCTSSTNANAKTPASGTCQGRRVGSFTVPRFGGMSGATASFGTLKVGDSLATASTSISDIKINGVSVIGSSVTAATGTNTTTTRAAMATAIANAINSYNSTPEYVACAGSSTTAPGCGSSPYSAYSLGTIASDTVAIIATTATGGTTPVIDDSRAGYAITVTSPSTTSTTALARTASAITVSNSGGGSGKLTSVKVGPAGGPFVEILNSTLSFGSNSSTNRKNAGKAICNQINSYVTSTPWDYFSRNDTTVGSKNCSTNVSFYIDANTGAAANGYQIIFTVSGGVVISTPPTLSGGVTVSSSVPTTVTSFTAGADSYSPFERVDIVSSRTTYPRASARSDCLTSTTSCSYDEEMTNFANWYTYYRTRNQMMKSAASKAFLPLGEKYRLGFNTINNGTFNNLATGGTNWLPVADLTSTQKSNWYTKLFAAGGSSGTPLRSALQTAGKYFEGTLSNTNSPIEHTCQQNFTILSSDGFWNGDSSFDIGDWDNVDDPAKFCSRVNGCYDGALGYDNSLSDVAAYYYRNDLRPDKEDNVPVSDKDNNPAQHMSTYTLSLGIDGEMVYRSDYDTATSGDYYRIRTGDSGCPWKTGACNWPEALADKPSAVDDLWHAAVTGHGKYFSAKDPASLASGLSSALNSLQIRVGAAAASSTSTPNVTQEDNYEFSATFRTVKWDGELIAQGIDTATGETLATIAWAARDQLDSRSSDNSDTRTIYTIGSTTSSRREFTWGNLTTAERAWFNNKCAGTGVWSQCVSLTGDEKTQANTGEYLLNYLRGQRAYEHYLTDPTDTSATAVEVFRKRDHILGDIAGSRPAYVSKPSKKFADAGYAAFVAENATRDAMIYAGGNDGMLHAFNVSDGSERWAYVPRIVMPEMYILANTSYGADHHYYVDGNPIAADVYIGDAWKTILVGGLNRGGRGYYALDITDPGNPLPLWEICHDSAICPLRSDADIGYSYGEPIITKRISDGKWIVIIASGYNNVSPGDGEGHLYILDAQTGALLHKIDNNTGTTATPSGMAKISDFVNDAQVDNKSSLVFGGDLLGNLWRFDLASYTVSKLALVTDASGTAQPITARPESGQCGTQRMVFVGTGSYLGSPDVNDTQLQTIWGVRDSTTSWGELRANSGMVEQTLSSITGGYALSTNPVDLTTQAGWFVDLDRNSGERISLDPVLVNGNLIALSTIPVASGSAACGTGGRSNMYQFNYCAGSGFSPGLPAGTLVSDSIVVGFTVIGLPSGARVKITKADGSKAVQTAQQGSGAGLLTRRVNWREITD